MPLLGAAERVVVLFDVRVGAIESTVESCLEEAMELDGMRTEDCRLGPPAGGG